MYKLTCDGDKATISIDSTHYLITQLSYKSGTIRLVNPKFASGSCGLPSQSLSPCDLSSSGFDHYQNDKGNSLSYLYPSCHFVSMIPAAEVRRH
ncbi:hypothetical protein ZIOFF_071171 [Zingiber officinale]|uniref:Uncharacterized protein n=1 Tax=Zingiber officinale TaxID=94328 RepID=A0A8J5EB99_ZINOF|nr:hypothetical protein ZIOFF_071171 [Zingiber officinale]